jgi:hypothetical protein
VSANVCESRETEKNQYVLFDKTNEKEKSKNGRKGARNEMWSIKNRKSEREEWELE